MKLTTEQSRALLDKHGAYVSEICDKCGGPVGLGRTDPVDPRKSIPWGVSFTRKDQDGVWCSRECRDGVEAAEHYYATRKHSSTAQVNRCSHCKAVLPKDRPSGSHYCDAACRQASYRAKKP